MKIGINYISLPSEKGSGVFRYMQLMFKAMADYNIGKVHFIIYKQKRTDKICIVNPLILFWYCIDNFLHIFG